MRALAAVLNIRRKTNTRNPCHGAWFRPRLRDPGRPDFKEQSFKMKHNTTILIVAALWAWLFSWPLQAEPAGAAFTYQGRLTDTGLASGAATSGKLGTGAACHNLLQNAKNLDAPPFPPALRIPS
jgi:hypothetical protein